MNTISSMLKFLGDTLGADPSTLTTTNKTLVGAINEVAGRVPPTVTTTGASIALGTSVKNIEQTIQAGTSSHGYTISGNGGIIIPKTGYYLLSGTWVFNSLGTSANALTVLFRRWNGAETDDIGTYGHTHTGAYCAIAIAPRLYYLTQGHVIFQSVRNNTAAVGNCSGVVTLQYIGS